MTLHTFAENHTTPPLSGTKWRRSKLLSTKNASRVGGSASRKLSLERATLSDSWLPLSSFSCNTTIERAGLSRPLRTGNIHIGESFLFLVLGVPCTCDWCSLCLGTQERPTLSSLPASTASSRWSPHRLVCVILRWQFWSQSFVVHIWTWHGHLLLHHRYNRQDAPPRSACSWADCPCATTIVQGDGCNGTLHLCLLLFNGVGSAPLGVRVWHFPDAALRTCRSLWVTMAVEYVSSRGGCSRVAMLTSFGRFCHVQGDADDWGQLGLQAVYAVCDDQHRGDGCVFAARVLGAMWVTCTDVSIHSLIPEIKGLNLEEMDVVFTVSPEAREALIQKEERALEDVTSSQSDEGKVVWNADTWRALVCGVVVSFMCNTSILFFCVTSCTSLFIDCFCIWGLSDFRN